MKPPLRVSVRGKGAGGGVIHAPGVPGAPPLREILIDEMTGENLRTGSRGSPRAWETPPGGQRPGGAGRDLGVMVRPGRNDLPVVVDTLAVATGGRVPGCDRFGLP